MTRSAVFNPDDQRGNQDEERLDQNDLCDHERLMYTRSARRRALGALEHFGDAVSRRVKCRRETEQDSRAERDEHREAEGREVEDLRI